MKIEAGGLVIACRDIYDEPATVNGVNVRRLRLELNAPLTEEELTALSGNHWTLHEDNGAVAGIKSGFNLFQGYSVSFAQVQELEGLKMQLAAISQELAARKTEAASAWGMVDSMQALMDAAGVTVTSLQEAAARKRNEAAKSEAETMTLATEGPLKQDT